MSDLDTPAGSADFGLDDRAFELVMLLADGELEPARRPEAEALLASNRSARALLQDLQASKVALRERIVEQPVTADLSMVRGRVMTKLPLEARKPVAEEPAGLWNWLRKLGFGKVSVAVGTAVAVAAWLLVTRGPAVGPDDGEAARQKALAALQATEQPAVIIEDMEVESGSVMVRPEEPATGSTIIWHFQPSDQGEG